MHTYVNGDVAYSSKAKMDRRMFHNQQHEYINFFRFIFILNIELRACLAKNIDHDKKIVSNYS